MGIRGGSWQKLPLKVELGAARINQGRALGTRPWGAVVAWLERLGALGFSLGRCCRRGGGLLGGWSGGLVGGRLVIA